MNRDSTHWVVGRTVGDAVPISVEQGGGDERLLPRLADGYQGVRGLGELAIS